MTLKQFVLTAEVQTALLGVIAILCFVKYRSRDIVVRLLGFYFVAGAMANISSWLLVRTVVYREYSNVPAVIFFPISIAFLSYIYLTLLFKRKLYWFLTLTVALIAIAALNFFFVQKTAVNSNLLTLSAGITICYCLWYFYTLVRDLPSRHVHRMPMFWINSGFLLLNCGTFVLFSFTSYLVNVLRNDLVAYWSFHNILSSCAYLVVLIGLYYDLRQVMESREARVSHSV